MPSLGNDLAAIREEKGISIEQIHNATKIPVHILNAIEDDSIFSELDQNATYIRSYIRSYAKQLDIDEERIIRALDQVEIGTYSGLLQEDYEGPLPKFQSRHQDTGEDDEDEKPEQKKEAKDSRQPKKEEPEAEADEIVRPQQTRPATGPPKPRAPEASRQQPSSEKPTIQSVDWVDMGKRFKPLKSQTPMRIGIAVIAILIASAGIIYYLSRNSEPSATSTKEEAAATTTEAIQADSLQINLANPQEADDSVQGLQNQPLESLSDTLGLVIYAAYEKLEPVRVYTDLMGSLNPYWIELGEGVRFQFVNTIRIRGPYGRMELLLNGHLIENFQERFLNPESGLVEIDREVFEGDSKWLQPPPDSLGLSVPDPRVINDQPVFN